MRHRRSLRMPAAWMCLLAALTAGGMGCAAMRQRDGGADGWRRTEIGVANYVRHRIRSGETLSGIAMAYYDTYMTPVYFVTSRSMFMTREALIGEPARQVGTVADVIRNLNRIDPDRLTVAAEIIIPRIVGLPFRAARAGAGSVAEAGPLPVDPSGAGAGARIGPSDRPASAPPGAEARSAAGSGAGATAAALPPPLVDPFDALMKEGQSRFESGEFGAAVAPLSRALAMRPRDGRPRDYLCRAHMALGDADLAAGRYMEAIRSYERALALNSQCPRSREKIAECRQNYMDAHYKKGLAHFEKEQLLDAIAEWERVVALDPDYRNVRKNIELALRLIKRLGEMDAPPGEMDASPAEMDAPSGKIDAPPAD